MHRLNYRCGKKCTNKTLPIAVNYQILARKVEIGNEIKVKMQGSC